VGSVFCDLKAVAFMSYIGLKSQYANLMTSTKEFAITYLYFFKKNVFVYMDKKVINSFIKTVEIFCKFSNVNHQHKGVFV